MYVCVDVCVCVRMGGERREAENASHNTVETQYNVSQRKEGNPTHFNTTQRNAIIQLGRAIQFNTTQRHAIQQGNAVQFNTTQRNTI